MRVIRTAGVALTVALVGSDGLAQPAPAAKLGRIQEVTPAGGAAERGQAPAATLPQPRPLPTPTVTETRGANGSPAAAFAPPAVCPPGGCPTPDLDPPLLGGALSGPYGTLTGPQRFQIEAELLLWFVKSGRYPPLVTTGLPASNGILGFPGTRSLFEEQPFESTLHTGARFGAVYWLDCQQRWGLDGRIWFLARRGEEAVFNSLTDPVLARPFTRLDTGMPFSQVTASPGLSTGSIAVNVETVANGAEVNLRRYLTSTPCYRLDLLGGFRYMGLNEEVRVTESFARTNNSNLAIGNPTALFGTVTDEFRTENSFYGAQLGVVGELRRGRWFMEGRATVALGSVHQSVQVNGAQSIALASGGMGVFPGGLLALPGANIGTFNRDRFAVLPEVGLKLGYHVTPNLRLAVGYNFLYLSHAVRPGDQIDPGLDVTRIPNFPVPGAQPLPVVRPTVPFNDTGVFVQGINFSVQWSF